MKSISPRALLLLSAIALVVTQDSDGQSVAMPQAEQPRPQRVIPKHEREAFARDARRFEDRVRKLTGDAEIKIYNGRRVRPGEAPWVVAFVDSDRRTQAVCGGALVAPSWVLTAGHCGIKPNEDLAVIGQPELTSQAIATPLSLACSGPTGSDLALVRLSAASGATPLSPETNPDSDRLAGQEMRIFGWGMTEGGSVSRHLLKAEVPIISRESCQGEYPQGALCPLCFCAWDQQGITDACQFDSGGPGILPRLAGGPLQVGVIREGSGCGQKPGIYSYVPGGQDWIGNVIRTVEASGVCPEVAP
jgi:hypothetical protein